MYNIDAVPSFSLTTNACYFGDSHAQPLSLSLEQTLFNDIHVRVLIRRSRKNWKPDANAASGNICRARSCPNGHIPESYEGTVGTVYCMRPILKER